MVLNSIGPVGFEIPVLCVVGDLKRKPGRFIKKIGMTGMCTKLLKSNSTTHNYPIQLSNRAIEFLCLLVKLLFLQQLISIKCYLDRFAVTLT